MARFPQSATSLNYRIKAEWADKIHAIWWAAGADSIHALRSGETATTIINRSSASGAGFDSENGVITGANNSVYFTDTESGGFGGLAQDSAHTLVAGVYGDLFNGVSGGKHFAIATVTPPDTFDSGAGIFVSGYSMEFRTAGGSGSNFIGMASDSPAVATFASRFDPEDEIATLRAWSNGSENTTKRTAASPNSASAISQVWLGASATGTGNTSLRWEFAAICEALSDADMVTITSDPASILEVVEADTTPPTLSNPTATATGQTTASGSVTTDEAGGLLYYLASANSTESAATVKGGDSQAVSATGVQNVGVTGLTHSTTYYLHFVHVDAAENESDVASSAQFTTDAPPPPATKGVRIQLSAGAESLTGLSVRWWDDPTATGAPDYSVDNEATDGSRWLEIDLDSTTANDVDDLGYLLVFKAGANPDDDMVAAGRVPIVDISA